MPPLPPVRPMGASRSASGLYDETAAGYSTLSAVSESSRSRSAAVLARNYEHREAVREEMLHREQEAQYTMLMAKRQKERSWRQRMAGSPYTVNLVGEGERIAEEMRVKQELDAWRKRYEEREKERLRSEVVQSAMADARKLQQLHRDKMAVQLEQKRLRALRDVQRSEARALMAQSDVRRRVVDATPEVREIREADFQARREQHWQEYAERRARLEAKQEAKCRAIILRDQARHSRVADSKRGPVLLEYMMGDPFQI